MSEYDVTPVQTEPGWSTTFDWPENLDEKSGAGKIGESNANVTFEYDATNGKVLMSVKKTVE